MDPELEKLYQEWEQEEIEYQEYLNLEIQESKKVQKNFQQIRDIELYNLCTLSIYLNLVMYCMKFIVLYVSHIEINKKNKNKIEKVNYSVHELD